MGKLTILHLPRISDAVMSGCHGICCMSRVFSGIVNHAIDPMDANVGILGSYVCYQTGTFSLHPFIFPELRGW